MFRPSPRLITPNHHIGQLGWLKLTVPSAGRRRFQGCLDDTVGRIRHPDRPVTGPARLPGDLQQLPGLNVGAGVAVSECDTQVTAFVADDDRPGCPAALADVIDFLDASFNGGPASGDQSVHCDHRRRHLRVFVGLDALLCLLGDALLNFLDLLGNALFEQVRERLADSGLHVVGHDRRRGVGESADRVGDLVRGAVVQQPAQQGGVAAPG